MRLYYLWKLIWARKKLQKLDAEFTLPIEEMMEKDPAFVAKWFLAQDDVRFWMERLK